ncbi:MAG: methyl-accepting chemotaxis protein [Tepidimonas taiwanensis]|nr:methyl-accepting chemotaxis protein [Tepidimonas taiwanensis]
MARPGAVAAVCLTTDQPFTSNQPYPIRSDVMTNAAARASAVNSGAATMDLFERAQRALDRWMLGLNLDWIPGFGRLSHRRRRVVLTVAVLVFIVIGVAALVAYQVYSTRVAKYTDIAIRLQLLSQRSAKNAQRAALGDAKAFEQMLEARKGFTDGLNTLIGGGGGLPPSPAAFQDDLRALQQRWEASNKTIQGLVEQRAVLEALGRAYEANAARLKDLARLADELMAFAPAGSATADVVDGLVLQLSQLAIGAEASLAGDTLSTDVAVQLSQKLGEFRAALNVIKSGDAARGIAPLTEAAAQEKIKSMESLLQALEQEVGGQISSMTAVLAAKQSAQKLYDESEALLDALQQLYSRYAAMGTGGALPLSVSAFILAVLGTFMITIMNVQAARYKAQKAAEENARNQEAILRLLNEMADLAEGNLTVRATVSEDITGAIADSVNYAIEELRTLVQRINDAAQQLAESTAAAREDAQALLDASQRQAQQIGDTSEAVVSMSQSIGEVSRNAAESAEVAQTALQASQRGRDAVRQTIDGMNAIRDQIQETSKRIKRLGESSQEIGEIVDLIGGITEQTNVLALNAAIQAAAAGESGKGFAVVAEEVQRLAERSAQATRRIGAIVAAIQADTQEAIRAMERSTQGVVQGAARSDSAGEALSEIETISVRLANLIESISRAMAQQASTAEQVSANMRAILRVTEETAERTRHSAQTVASLNELSERLRVSVAGFQL